MLEIKHLTKVYRTKGGSDTRALDDVSINFEETGLVFLLGKSGSGKSTLLNLAGGLDSPTSGEVVVMGKSSKDFTGSDFDSYRNTFVGFIFQEYNVLNEFSVEDNIALALELQGKPKDKQRIAELLHSVELERFAKRKPNTLSGGQKQRIAIARALVKDPQIIMADEPTGALDSATGKQVFDTLKKLSESRLVIVVSHDREFAEIYGDRIVELKDGKIISDVSKKKVTPKKLDENVTLIGENTLAVKSGEQLTEENFLTIKKFLSESNGSVVLTKGEKEIADFKRATRMGDDGTKEHFEDTKEEELNIKQYDKSQTKFIRSRLPASKAIKIGAAGLKLKPFRLVLTILLSFFAFVMFGLFSTMMVYDNDEVLTTSFMESDYEFVEITKQYRATCTYQYSGESYTYETYRQTKFTPEEVKNFSLFGNSLGMYHSPFELVTNASVVSQYKEYYLPKIRKIAEATDDNPFANKLLQGTFPVEENEICVSSYLLECMQNAQFRAVDDKGNLSSGNATVEIRSAEDLIGKNLAFYDKIFKVTGVFNSGAVSSKYDKLKESGSDWRYESYLEESAHSLAFVSTKYVGKNKQQLAAGDEYIQYFDYSSDPIYVTGGENIENRDRYLFSTYNIKAYNADETMLPVTFFGEDKKTLADDELILPIDFFRNVGFQIPEPNWDDYENSDEYYKDLEDYQNAQRRLDTAFQIVSNHAVWEDKFDEQNQPIGGGWVPVTDEELAEALAVVTAHLKKNDVYHKAGIFLGEYGELTEYKVVGFFDSRIGNYGYDGIYCSKTVYDQLGSTYSDREIIETKYEKEADACFYSIFVPLSKDTATFESLIAVLGKDHTNEQTDVFYTMNNSLYQSVEMVNETVDTLSTVFLWVGIVLALFAALLLFNFISMSISNKKKEIGILRAVGARGTDVFKIFFSESGIIVGICTVLSIIGSFVLTGVINGILKADVGLDVTLFVFGGVSVAMMVGVALVVAFISTFLPVYFASKKKPVDSIRAL